MIYNLHININNLFKGHIFKLDCNSYRPSRRSTLIFVSLFGRHRSIEDLHLSSSRNTRSDSCTPLNRKPWKLGSSETRAGLLKSSLKLQTKPRRFEKALFFVTTGSNDFLVPLIYLGQTIDQVQANVSGISNAIMAGVEVRILNPKKNHNRCSSLFTMQME